MIQVKAFEYVVKNGLLKHNVKFFFVERNLCNHLTFGCRYFLYIVIEMGDSDVSVFANDLG